MFQSSEPYGWAADGQAVDPNKDGTESINITIRLASDDQPPYPIALVDARFISQLDNIDRFNVGTVSSLDNEWFSGDQATKGLWQPNDRRKIPVLFIPDIDDTLRRFAAVIEQLDQSKFQP